MASSSFRALPSSLPLTRPLPSLVLPPSCLRGTFSHCRPANSPSSSVTAFLEVGVFLVERIDAELDERDCKFTNRVAKQNMLRVLRFPSQQNAHTVIWNLLLLTACKKRSNSLSSSSEAAMFTPKEGQLATQRQAKPQKSHTTKKIEKAAYEMTFELYTRCQRLRLTKKWRKFRRRKSYQRRPRRR